jgi:hypothetical protein
LENRLFRKPLRTAFDRIKAKDPKPAAVKRTAKAIANNHATEWKRAWYLWKLWALGDKLNF